MIVMMMRGNTRAAALSFLLLLSSVPRAEAQAPAILDLPIERFPDSSELRAQYWDSYFSAPRQAVFARSPRKIKSGSGEFLLSAVDAKEYFYQIISPRPQEAGATRAAQAEPPLYAQGTWILKRSRSTGAPVQAKVFLRSDPGCFIRIYPDGDRSRMDLVVYGGVMNREVALPLPFGSVFSSTFEDIVSWTAGLVDWELFSPRLGMYAGTRAFAQAVRARLPGLRYADDGAFDAEGRPVYIATGEPQSSPTGLNCSGFAKWVVDGFYYPLVGSYLDPRAMAKRHSDLRSGTFAAAFEEDLDPYFGLDWTRNLGAAMADATFPSRSHGIKENDVTAAPFALFATEASAAKVPAGAAAAVNGSSIYEDYPAVNEELGYEGRGLKALLYALAIREPGAIYLASLSRKGGGALPGLRRHYHVAVLAPYFEESGEFRVAVFESAAETGIDALAARAANDFVHLVRLRVLPDFEPPALP